LAVILGRLSNIPACAFQAVTLSAVEGSLKPGTKPKPQTKKMATTDIELRPPGGSYVEPETG